MISEIMYSETIKTMPIYEMTMLIRLLKKTEITATLKRTAELIFNKGGIIRKIDNLGKLQTPYKMSKDVKLANYFIFHFDIPPIQLFILDNGLKRDIDIIKWKIYNPNESVQFKCTLNEELLPPPYRLEVQKLIHSGNKHRMKTDKFKFKFNTGLDYYPFQ